LIDEHTFSRAYASFWREVTPVSEIFVRRMNLLAGRAGPPLASVVEPSRRAFVNELAFCMFADLRSQSGEVLTRVALSDVDLRRLSRVAMLRIQAVQQTGGIVREVTDEEVAEAQALVQRLEEYFSNSTNVMCEPSFKGCGILEACQGDVLASGCLYEIKAGNRPFRSEDVRQVLIYAALDRASGGGAYIEGVAFYNPRQGREFSITLRDLCIDVGGHEKDVLLDMIIYELSRADLSH
jgi:hypothetical protein